MTALAPTRWAISWSLRLASSMFGCRLPIHPALVVASTTADASEDDQSLVGLECDSDVSRARLSGELASAGLKPLTMVLLRPPGSPTANVLVEVDGYLTDDDTRLSHLGSVLRRPIVLGNYAVPVPGGR